jgi:hypothetical protein
MNAKKRPVRLTDLEIALLTDLVVEKFREAQAMMDPAVPAERESLAKLWDLWHALSLATPAPSLRLKRALNPYRTGQRP